MSTHTATVRLEISLTELAILSRKLEKIAKGDEKQLLGLVTSISKTHTGLSVSDLLDLKDHPCNRGNAFLSADLLYPFIEPLLTKNWHGITQDDMFPVLEVLHSGVYAQTCPHSPLNTIDNFDCLHLQGSEHGEPAARIRIHQVRGRNLVPIPGQQPCHQ
jgi:hypothetical protein